MKNSYPIPLACLAAMSLAGPVHADIGTLQGTNQKQPLEAEQSVVEFAQSWGMAPEHVAWANDLGAEGILSPGTPVTIPARILPPNPPANGAVVNLAERGMYVFKEGRYRGFYPLTIGRGDNKEYRTPTGQFKIVDRVENPDWHAPDSKWAKALQKELSAGEATDREGEKPESKAGGKVANKDAKGGNGKSSKIAGDNKDNPLGEHWFGIDHPEGGLGFHDNLAPETIGAKVSHGCMRLYPEHAEKLFGEGLLGMGDTIRIEDRPIVLGEKSTGQLMISVFPTAYGKVDLEEALKKALKAEGLTGKVPAETIASLTATPTGVPTRVDEKTVSYDPLEGLSTAQVMTRWLLTLRWDGPAQGERMGA